MSRLSLRGRAGAASHGRAHRLERRLATSMGLGCIWFGGDRSVSRDPEVWTKRAGGLKHAGSALEFNPKLESGLLAFGAYLAFLGWWAD